MTSTSQATSGQRTYTETVARGFYEKNIGRVSGKYDNVRTYWEDPLTRFFLRPLIEQRLRTCETEKRGMRIVDLGCGAGQGYELLTRIYQRDLDLDESPRYVLPAEKISLYLGLDLVEAMLEKGRGNYAGNRQVEFRQADLRAGIPTDVLKTPFDVYYSSYGALSHLAPAELRRCLGEIARSAPPGALIVLDLIGRYSPEWPLYWAAEEHSDRMFPYSMSYLYEEDERRNRQVEEFPLCFWTGNEVRMLCREVSADTGVTVRTIELMDRSIFVGRHVDTRDYGSSLPALRSLVNHLLELNVRTRLEQLRVSYQPPESGPAELHHFLTTLATCWNLVLDFTIARLGGERISLVGMNGWRQFPPALQMSLMTMDRVIDSIAWIDSGDVRANILEPQLAYMLRRLEFMIQQGMGCGHSLLAILQTENAGTN